MAKKTKVDWEKIWTKFNRWFEKDQFENAEWDVQQKKIQKLVEKEIV